MEAKAAEAEQSRKNKRETRAAELENLDPEKAAKTKVVATVLEQFKGDKALVFKFKKRKNYKKLRGHRQNLTRVKIESVGMTPMGVLGFLLFAALT